MDYCPRGDLSSSYYDGTCEKSMTSGVSLKEKNKITSKKKEYRMTTLKYRGYSITQFRGYSTSQNALKLSMGVVGNNSLSSKEKEILVNRINAFLVAKHNFDTKNGDMKQLKSQYNKETLLLKSAMSKMM